MPIKIFPMFPFSARWGEITGNIDEQSDLISILDDKSDVSHNHDESYEPKNANIQAHISIINNPHSVTKAQIGLGAFSQEIANRTIAIPYTYTATQIQSEIDSIGKFIPYGVTVTIQFSNDSAKYLGNEEVVEVGGGKVRIACPNHCFVEGDVVSIDGTTNYNGDYTLPSQSGADANHFIITASFVSETTTTNAIARKPCVLEAGLIFSGFYGGGSIAIKGNTNETDANALHTTQQVYLKSTSNVTAIKFYNNQVQFQIQNLKIQFNSATTSSSGIFSSFSDISLYCSYILGTTTSYGYAINILNSGATAYLRYNYVSNVLYGIASQLLALVYSNENDDYGIVPAYGLMSSTAILFKRSTQPAGSVANELKSDGGQIF